MLHSPRCYELFSVNVKSDNTSSTSTKGISICMLSSVSTEWKDKSDQMSRFPLIQTAVECINSVSKEMTRDQPMESERLLQQREQEPVTEREQEREQERAAGMEGTGDLAGSVMSADQ